MLTIGIIISVHVTRLDLVCHLTSSSSSSSSSQPLGAIASLVHYFSHDRAFNWVLVVCSLEGRTHKILCPLVLPSVFNWTVTGFVQGTKTNGSGPGQFQDDVRPRRVNLKAESQVVHVYTRVCLCVRGRGIKVREKSPERIIVKRLLLYRPFINLNMIIFIIHNHNRNRMLRHLWVPSWHLYIVFICVINIERISGCTYNIWHPYKFTSTILH